MAENKTKLTTVSVNSYLSSIEDEGRRADCQALAKLMSKVSKHEAKMWGTSIVGFGVRHYQYESGREGDTCVVGFASRKNDVVLYLGAKALSDEGLLEKLGKHKLGKGCLHVRKLADLDGKVLERLVAASLAAKRSS